MKNLDVYMKQLPVDYDMLFLGNCEEIATTTTPDVLVYKKNITSCADGLYLFWISENAKFHIKIKYRFYI